MASSRPENKEPWKTDARGYQGVTKENNPMDEGSSHVGLSNIGNKDVQRNQLQHNDNVGQETEIPNRQRNFRTAEEERKDTNEVVGILQEFSRKSYVNEVNLQPRSAYGTPSTGFDPRLGLRSPYQTSASAQAVGLQSNAIQKPVGLRQLLPEPALTAVLPTQRAASMPSISQKELASMLATTEQYLSLLRINKQFGHFEATRDALATHHNGADGQQVGSQTAGNMVANGIGNSTNNPKALPGMTKQLLAEVEVRKRECRIEIQNRRAKQMQALGYSGSGIGLNPGVAARDSVTAVSTGPTAISRVRKVTPKTVRPSRFCFRGPSNAYRSFGDLTQTDMPTPALKHFSIVRLSRSANYGNAMTPRNAPSFSVFQELLKKPELIIILAGHLRVQELLILYRICKPFHDIVNQRFTTVIWSQAIRRAPESAKTFPFRCYSKLCIGDPGQRPHPVEELAAVGQSRNVPSFRWLLMLCFREMVCHDIRMMMAEDGTPLPEQCESVMKKIWFVMDIPDTTRRIGVIQNPDIFSDTDIFFATLFFVKMDMRFTDPITGSGRDGMRRLLLSQPSLSTLWRTLKRTALTSKMDTVKMYMRWKWQLPERLAGQSVFGVHPSEIGIMQYEGWGRSGSRVRLQRPDDIILKESIRRRLNLQLQYTDMFLWGYVNPRTLQDIPPVVEYRNLDALEGVEKLLLEAEDKARVEAEKRVSTRVVLQ